jgi:glycine betaine/proline transport system ATP-binding protein
LPVTGWRSMVARPTTRCPDISEELPGEDSATIRVESLTKIYGPKEARAAALLRQGLSREEIRQTTAATVAVEDVSFSVRAGETFVVMGLSGSGKSTLIRCLNRLVEPTSGRVLIDNADVSAFDDRALRQFRLRKIAMVFQHVALMPHRSVLENVAFGLKIRGVHTKQRREAAMAALEQVDLAQWAEQRPAKLSGGMQQRVGLARALAVNPDVLLMDEPFSALDPLIRSDMQRELLTLQKSVNKTIVFITHDLHEALTLGGRIAIMKDGRFVQIGRPVQIIEAPTDEYVAAFTRDIDRARVLTARDIMRQPHVSSITNMGVEQPGIRAFAANNDGRIAGPAMRSPSPVPGEFPRVSPETRLCDLYEMCGSGTPIAVVDTAGHILGMVHPLDLFRALMPAAARG